MSTIPFPGSDILDQVETLKEAGFSDAQAKAQIKAMQGVISAYDGATRKELATKGDIQDVRREIQDVRIEIQKSHNSILGWMIALIIALGGVVVAGFSYVK